MRMAFFDRKFMLCIKVEKLTYSEFDFYSQTKKKNKKTIIKDGNDFFLFVYQQNERILRHAVHIGSTNQPAHTERIWSTLIHLDKGQFIAQYPAILDV